MQPLRVTTSYLRLIKSELNQSASNFKQQSEAMDKAIEVIEDILRDVEM
jgi:hypothetical protein